jgi:hypothetical protein
MGNLHIGVRQGGAAQIRKCSGAPAVVSEVDEWGAPLCGSPGCRFREPGDHLDLELEAIEPRHADGG